jgi:hypothetical protein
MAQQMSENIDMDDFWESRSKEDILFLRALNKSRSYNKILPSEHLDDHQYQLYLEYATEHELEENAITKETYLKIMS